MPALAKHEVVSRTFQVKLGWCAFARTKDGVCSFVLPVASRERAQEAVRRRHPNARASKRSMDELVKTVKQYFYGWRTDFSPFPLDCSVGTAFEQRVWSIARRIPYGAVRTYGWIGLELGRPGAARAVGRALAVNPVPLLVPCHRVVAGDGRLGGFSAQGGARLKATMLRLEGVRLAEAGDDMRVLA
jgi:methylated-DNA-[protein]-cysteine S-methyltransferase